MQGAVGRRAGGAGITVKLIAEIDASEKNEAIMKRLKQLLITEN